MLLVTSGKRLVELRSFSAMTEEEAGEHTQLRLGGLATYKTSQPRVWDSFRLGEEHCWLQPYKRFLDQAELRATDSSASIMIACVRAQRLIWLRLLPS